MQVRSGHIAKARRTRSTTAVLAWAPKPDSFEAPLDLVVGFAAWLAVAAALDWLVLDMVDDAVVLIDEVVPWLIVVDIALVVELTSKVVMFAPTDMFVTGPVLLLPAFWYQSMEKVSGTERMFQPLDTMMGYSAMNTSTVLLLSSCSSIRSPGDLVPVNQPVIVASTFWMVYVEPGVPIAQSAESGRRQRGPWGKGRVH